MNSFYWKHSGRAIKRSILAVGLILLVYLSLFSSTSRVQNTTVKNTEPVALGLPSGGPYEYVVVGPAYIESVVGELINWKRLRGISAVFVSIEYINSSYTGDDLAEKLYKFCDDADTTWNTTYMLFIGDDVEIPLRYMYNPDDSWDDANIGGWTDSLTPSDQYYAGLNVSWDTDGDLRYGELTDDSADWQANINIGRIPLTGITMISQYIDRLIAYEQTPFYEALNNTLLIGTILRQIDPYGVFLQDANASQYISEVLQPLFADAGVNVTQLLALVREVNPSLPSNLTQSNLLDLLENNSYALINVMTNSFIDDLRRVYGDYDASEILLSTLQGQTVNFSNSLLVLGYGITASFDYNYEDANDKPLVLSLLENPDGPISIIGYSRGTWYTAGNDTADGLAALLNLYFWQNFLNSTDHRAGTAFYQAREAFAQSLSSEEIMAEQQRKLLFSQFFIGDPETPIWWGAVNQVVVSVNQEIYEDSLVLVRVTNATGAALNNAQVSILGDDGVISRVYTNGTGYALVRAPSTVGNYTLLAEHEDYDYQVAQGTVIENNDPVITGITPSASEFFRYNETVTLTVDVTDLENVTAGRVIVETGDLSFSLNKTANPSGQEWSGAIRIPFGGAVGNQSFEIIAYDLLTNHTVSNTTYLFVKTAIPTILTYYINSTANETDWYWSSSGASGSPSVYKWDSLVGIVNASETDTYVTNLTVAFWYIGSVQTHKVQATLVNGTFHIISPLNFSWQAGQYSVQLVVSNELNVNRTLVLGVLSVEASPPTITEAIVLQEPVVIPASIGIRIGVIDLDHNIAQVKVDAMGPTGVWYNTTAFIDLGSYYAYIPTISTTPGTWTIYIQVIDTDGAQAVLNTPLTAEVIQVLDLTTPIILVGISVAALGIAVFMFYVKKKGL